MPDNDEAQQLTQPDEKPARQTAMQVAQSALDLAHAVDDSLADLRTQATASAEELSEKLTGLDMRLTEMREQGSTDAPNRQQVDGRIAEALEPFKEEVGGYQGAVNRKLDAHATRLAKLEKAREDQANEPSNVGLPVLAREQLDHLMARLEQAERYAAEAGASESALGITRQDIVDLIRDQVAVQVEHALKDRPAATTVLHHSMSPFGVRAKVLKMMRMVDQLSKDRQTDSGPRYQYRSIDDAMDAVGHAMREVGLVLETSVVDSKLGTTTARKDNGQELLWTTVQLLVRYTFVDPEDNSEHTYEMAGEGRAADDKATSKAAAMALKYGLLHALMIPVKGMPDGDAESPQVTRSQPAQQPQASRAEQMASQPHPSGQPAQQAQQPPARPSADKMARARDAKRALDNLHRVPFNEQHQRLVGIGNLASQEGLLNLEVEGASIRAWLGAAEQTLEQRSQEQARDDGAAF